MTSFRYRAATPSGGLRTGAIEGASIGDALEQLRRLGLTPIEADAVDAQRPAAQLARPLPIAALAKSIGQLAVMLDAGLSLDRALAVQIADMAPRSPECAAFEALLRGVKEGLPLSRAMGDAGRAFPPITTAMTAAGEAEGRTASALAKLADTLERAEALRTTVINAAIYPGLLLIIAASVIAVMLFWVVPQFEGLFSDAGAALPPMTRAVLAVSHGARRYGLWVVAGLAIGAVAVWRLLKRPAVRASWDRALLRTPQIGPLVAMAEAARFMRVLASLVGGGVSLPDALAIARRSLLNSYMAAAIDDVAKGLREGEGLTEPLAATGVFPALVLSYLRTGEETAQLPRMLDKLSDTLDRELRIRLERLVGLLTPLITVSMGAIVAVIIASVMTAILGFNDLALSP